MTDEKAMSVINNSVSVLAEFDQYFEQPNPSCRKKAAAWKTAIGLQAVDGLQPSQYLLQEAKRNIEGKVSIDELRKNLYGGFHKFEKVENPRCQPPPIELYRYASSLSTDSMLRLSCKRSC